MLVDIVSQSSAVAEPLIWVRRQWDDAQRLAAYRPSDISNPHWDFLSGGVMAATTRPWLYAYVRCDLMVAGDVAHSCQHDDGPHRIKVCITKAGNDQRLYRQLSEQAGPKPPNRAKRWWRR